MTRDLMFIAANILSREDIVEKLQEAISEWQLVKTKESLTQLEFFCTLITFKDIIEHMGGIENVLKKARETDAHEKLFQIAEN